MQEDKRNIEVFATQFTKSVYQKLFKRISYFTHDVINEVVEEEYSALYSLKLIPEYINFVLRNNKFLIKKIPQNNWGYSIYLDHIESVDAYLLHQFKSKKRSIIKRYISRVEECLNVSYKYYYGHIEYQEYLFLMNSLYAMITKRFNQLNETHKNLSEWSYLVKSTYAKILSKEASLFVIFDDKTPIEISLNYHYDKVLFSYVSSFDIDYAKFGLGHVEIFKQLEWCIKNGYILFEMGVGGTDYKRRWSNNIYQYNHYIIYSRKHWHIALLLYTKSPIKEFLKSKKINEVLPKIVSLLKKREIKNSKYHTELGPISNINTLDEDLITSSSPIDSLNSDYVSIKKNMLDFMYTTETKANDNRIYKITKNEFIIVNKQHYQYIKTLNC